MVTFLIAVNDSPGLHSSTRSINRKGYRWGRYCITSRMLMNSKFAILSSVRSLFCDATIWRGPEKRRSVDDDFFMIFSSELTLRASSSKLRNLTEFLSHCAFGSNGVPEE